MTWPATREHIRVIYKALLNREPDETGVEGYLGIGDVGTIIDMVRQSEEASMFLKEHDHERYRGSPFFHYNSRIDIEAIVRSHARSGLTPTAGRLTNYLGVTIDPGIFPSLLADLAGTVEDIPIPANWHADMAEFGAALRAVDLASDTFRVLELGCGWGCWLLNTGVAARSRGLKVDLIGAEADAGHVAFAERGCNENGFTAEQYRIVRQVVGAKRGIALFPRQARGGSEWGLEPVFNVSDEQVRDAERTGQFDVLPVGVLEDFVPAGQPINLLHIDIQGGEAEFISSCLESIDRTTGYLVVGTHSRQIEAQIFDLMMSKSWILEVERPAFLSLDGDIPSVIVDGVQGWRNPRM